MEMKPLSTFFLLSLVLFACVTEARPSPGEYWKSKMNGEAMPKALTDVVSDSDAKTSRFVKDFNTKPNVIIYHSNYHANKHAQAPKPC
ncbi:hypothetical protein ACP275_14G118600 [Erythranthe tilingii]